jgi:hypothetical protein
VASLADNYLRLTNPKDDVVFLHFGEVPTSEQHSLVRLCGVDIHARFALVPSNYSTLPPGTTPMEKWQHPKRFSVGYRHMIRLYTIGIWHIVAAEGYEYVMRMDEDSVILSPIQYNIFERMRSRGIEYMYRLASWEGIPGFSPDSFHRFISKFLINRTIAPEWLLDSCVHRSVHEISLLSTAEMCTVSTTTSSLHAWASGCATTCKTFYGMPTSPIISTSTGAHLSQFTIVLPAVLPASYLRLLRPSGGTTFYGSRPLFRFSCHLTGWR